MKESAKPENDLQFSLVEGGPFHSFMERLGLLGPDRLPSWRTALVLALIAWLPPMLLDIAQSLLQVEYSGWGFFKDPTVYTRYLVAIVAMVATERFADRQISKLLNQFQRAPLLEPQNQIRFRTIVERADRQASLPLVEGALLLLALLWSLLSFYYISTISDHGWEKWSSGGETHLSWAGTAATLLSNPIFLFLVLRWFWRFLVWALLLLRIARLPLRLTAIHPDRAGGLGFMALFPGIFSGFVFALSCVISSSLIKSLTLIPISQGYVWLIVGGWVLLIALLFLLPLFFFSASMIQERDKASLEYGRLAQIHHQTFHDNWVNGNHSPEKLLSSSDLTSVADMNTTVEATLAMRIVPLNLVAVSQILCAALIPFIAVVAALIPMKELLQWLLGAIF